MTVGKPEEKPAGYRSLRRPKKQAAKGFWGLFAGSVQVDALCTVQKWKSGVHKACPGENPVRRVHAARHENPAFWPI